MGLINYIKSYVIPSITKCNYILRFNTFLSIRKISLCSWHHSTLRIIHPVYDITTFLRLFKLLLWYLRLLKEEREYITHIKCQSEFFTI
jgi:hypothetical protein